MSEAATLSVRRLLYFADPMCSWCWGFSPVIANIAAACAGLVPIRLCVGGLRAGETKPMDGRSGAYIRHHWEEVAAATGQPFDFRFFERERFVYDTEPACRAAVAIRNLAPEASLQYLAAVQRAFYAENRDVTQEDALADIAAAFVDPEDFRVVFNAAEVHEATQADFRLVQGLGIQGFPTVLLQDGQRLAALTAGWQPFDALAEPLNAWLAGVGE
ncbi:MAG: DsbA family protein [Rhodospirillales bacterium]|nr:DsbA family protein [Rhodospirillales bacterium]